MARVSLLAKIAVPVHFARVSRIFYLPAGRQVWVVFAKLGAYNTQQTIYKHVSGKRQKSFKKMKFSIGLIAMLLINIMY